MNVRALCVAAAAALALVGAPVVAPTDASATPAAAYQQASTVTAVALQTVNEQDPPPITGIDKPFSAYTAFVTGELDSTGVSDVRAAVATPGTGLEQGLTMLEGVAGCDQCPPVSNPLEVYAAYPATKDQSTQSAPQTLGPLVATAGSATVAADSATNSGSATTAGAGLLSGSTAALSLGAMSSSLTQTLTDTGLVVRATSSVASISLAGLVTIDGVSATATQTLENGAVTGRDADVHIGAVTALGLPAAIDGSGVHIVSAGDQGVALATLNSTLATALSKLGLSVTAGPVDRSATGSGGRASASALSISYAQTLPSQVNGTIGGLPALPSPLPQLPSLPATYTGTVVLGSAGTVTGSVSVPDQTITLPDTTLPPVSTPGGAVAGVPSRTVFEPGTPGVPGSSVDTPGAASDVVTRSFGRSLQDWSLRAPYLVLVGLAVLALVGVCRGAYRRLHAEEDM